MHRSADETETGLYSSEHYSWRRNDEVRRKSNAACRVG